MYREWPAADGLSTSPGACSDAEPLDAEDHGSHHQKDKVTPLQYSDVVSADDHHYFDRPKSCRGFDSACIAPGARRGFAVVTPGTLAQVVLHAAGTADQCSP